MAETVGVAEGAPAATPPGPVSGGRDRAAILAEMPDMDHSGGALDAPPVEGDETPVTKPGKPKEDEPEEADEPAEVPEADDDDEPAPVAAKVDPQLAKRLDAVQKAERRAKEAVALQREQFEQERAKWAPRLAKAEEFEALAKRAKYDPTAVLMHLGLTEEDLEPAARSLYGRSKAAAADPKNREAVARMEREREHADEIKQTRSELQELKQQLAERDQREVTQRDVGRYLDNAVKAAGDETPLVRTMIAKNPEGTKQRLHQVAVYLAEQSGEAPDPEDVTRTLEKIRRDELEEMGVDVDQLIKAAPKKTTPVASEKRTAKTLSNDLNAPTAPRSAPKSRKELRSEVARELEDGRLEQ